ncbi:MAG TPA: hypothetical protein VE593_04575 [Nitrososphaeraceae archaeon]|nr:hypothetical protein [Nitrososphaeraceae archaeon]
MSVYACTNYAIHYTFIIHYFDIPIMRNQRRVGEALMIASGVGVAAGGFFLGIMFLAYGGLAIAGLGIFSVFWR